MSHIEREKQRYISTGVATGELILAANLLGYRTGLCTAFDWTELQKFFEGNKVNLLIGVGKPHPDKDRREHEEVYNKDIFLQSHKTGPDNEKWKFPTFKKEDYWGVEGFGDVIESNLSWNKEVMRKKVGHLFCHMTGVWKYSDNGIDWTPIREEFAEEFKAVA